MASCTPLTLILLSLTIPFLLTSQTKAQKAPLSSAPINVTAILEKGGQFTVLIDILNDTQLTQIESLLKSNPRGITIFAPSNNAFQNLKPGTLNHLTTEQKVQLILYHVTRKYYSLSDLLTVSHPVKTQAPWKLYFSEQGSRQVNVSTGVVTTRVDNALREEFPLAVYPVDQVLLPEELSEESPGKAPAPGKEKSGVGRIGGFGSLVVGFCVICMGILLS